MDDRRIALEAEYEAALIDVLRRVAAGTWGLFDHRKDRVARAAYAPVIDALTELGEEIDDLRGQLSEEPFALHHEFFASRGPVAASAPGEPRQAQEWLKRLVPPAG